MKITLSLLCFTAILPVLLHASDRAHQVLNNGKFTSAEGRIFTDLSFPPDADSLYELEIESIVNGVNTTATRFEILAGWENGILLQTFDGLLDSYYRRDSQTVEAGRIEVSAFYDKPYDVRIQFRQEADNGPWFFQCFWKPSTSKKWISGGEFQTAEGVDLSGKNTPVAIGVAVDGDQAQEGTFRQATVRKVSYKQEKKNP